MREREFRDRKFVSFFTSGLCNSARADLDGIVAEVLGFCTGSNGVYSFFCNGFKGSKRGRTLVKVQVRQGMDRVRSFLFPGMEPTKTAPEALNPKPLNPKPRTPSHTRRKWCSAPWASF